MHLSAELIVLVKTHFKSHAYLLLKIIRIHSEVSIIRPLWTDIIVILLVDRPSSKIYILGLEDVVLTAKVVFILSGLKNGTLLTFV